MCLPLFHGNVGAHHLDLKRLLIVNAQSNISHIAEYVVLDETQKYGRNVLH